MLSVSLVASGTDTQLVPSLRSHWYFFSRLSFVTTVLGMAVNSRVRPLPITAAALIGVAATFGVVNLGPSTHSVWGPPFQPSILSFSTVRTRHS